MLLADLASLVPKAQNAPSFLWEKSSRSFASGRKKLPYAMDHKPTPK